MDAKDIALLSLQHKDLWHEVDELTAQARALEGDARSQRDRLAVRALWQQAQDRAKEAKELGKQLRPYLPKDDEPTPEEEKPEVAELRKAASLATEAAKEAMALARELKAELEALKATPPA